MLTLAAAPSYPPRFAERKVRGLKTHDPPPPHNTAGTILAPPCGPVLRSSGVAVVVAILNPLPHVAVGIMYSPAILGKRRDRRSKGVAITAAYNFIAGGEGFLLKVLVSAVGVMALSPRANGISEREACSVVAGARRILPFCFSWQPVVLPGLSLQP